MDEISEKLRLVTSKKDLHEIYEFVYAENNENIKLGNKIILESIKLLQDEEKVRLLEYVRTSNEANDYIFCIENDELKLNIIEEIIKKDSFNYHFLDFTESVVSVISDELKLNFLKKHIEEFKLYNRNDHVKIIKSIKKDEVKLKALEEFTFLPRQYSDIISTIESDENRIKAMSLYLDTKEHSCYSNVIASFKSDEIRMKFINSEYMGKPNLKDINEIVQSIKSNISKIEFLGMHKEDIPYYTESGQKVFEHFQFENDQERVIVGVILSKLYLGGKNVKSTIFKDIKIDKYEELLDLTSILFSGDDTPILEYVSNISNEEIRNTMKRFKAQKEQILIDLLESLKIEDSLKIRLLEKIDDDNVKAKIIAKLKHDADKIEQLEKLDDDTDKVEVIITLKNDTDKIEQLEKLNNDKVKAIIIVTLKNDTDKIEQLEKLNDDKAKAEVIVTLKKDTDKLEQLEKLNNDKAKLRIILTLEDYDTKMEQVKKLNGELDKIIITELIEAYEDETLSKTSLNDRKKLLENLLDKNRTYTLIGLDNSMTIGMEIESEGVMSEILEEAQEILKRQIDGTTRSWETKGDGSLDAGVEVVSPILTDNKEDVEDIYIICTLLQKCGQEITEKCGGHIHIGADYLTSKESYMNLFEIWGNTEKILCIISNEKGNIPRSGLQDYATPISPKLHKALEKGTINLESEEDLDKFVREIQKVQHSRESGLNLLNINDGKNTIEFRIPNGSINPDSWIENAKLFGRIIQVSQKLAEIEKQTEITEEDRKLLDLRDMLKEEVPEQEKLEILLELLFTEQERIVYKERYISNSRLLEQLQNEENPLQGTGFRGVDFKNKKHKTREFYDIAISSRIVSSNDAVRETVEGIKTEEEPIQTTNKEEYGE